MDTRNADSAVWLIKIPPALAGSWKATCDHVQGDQVDESGQGNSLGRIITETGTDGETSYLELPDSMVGSSSAPLPKRFRLQRLPVSAVDTKMHVISFEAPPDKAKELVKPKVDGAITQRLDLLPMAKDAQGAWVLDDKYLALVRSRTEAASKKTSVVGTLVNNKETSMQQLETQKNALKELERRNKAKESSAKAEAAKHPKLGKDELEAVLFRLFERTAAWPFKALMAETRQPQAHLKAVLDGIAVQQRRGPNKDKYELKPEYRRKAAPGEAAPGGA